MTLTAGQNAAAKKTYYSATDKIQLQLMKDGTEYSTQTFTEKGGSFLTAQQKEMMEGGRIVIKNMSVKNMIRYLKVYEEGVATPVYALNGSVGLFEPLEIYLPAGKRYYVTMDYGVTSSFVTLTTEGTFSGGTNFLLNPYYPDGETTTLNVNDRYGDFRVL